MEKAALAASMGFSLSEEQRTRDSRRLAEAGSLSALVRRHNGEAAARRLNGECLDGVLATVRPLATM